METKEHMMDKEYPATEAQRIADLLDQPDLDGFTTSLDQEAAAELRRLDAENTELQLYKNLAAEFGLSIFPDLEELESELLEQARIIGMGAERELAAQARIAELETEIMRLTGEVASRNLRALEGDKAKAAFDLAYARTEKLEAANTELLEALKQNAQALSWLALGECRGFADTLPTANEAIAAARAALQKHGINC